MDYLSVLVSITSILDSETKKINKNQTLRKMFLLECRCNQKLLAIARWKDVSDGIRNEALKRLSSDCAKAFYTISDKTMLGKLIEKINFDNSKENVFEKATDTSKIVSLITRLEALSFLGNISNELQSQSKAKYSIRIDNLNKVIEEVIDVLENQLKD